MATKAADILIETLMAYGVDVVFGMPGDGINGVMEALRTRTDRIRFVQVRNEEAAGFAAVAYAKFTGRLGCCLATTGPGGVHLLNGLYDAKLDRVPVIAVTGLPYHDLIDTFTQQDVDLPNLAQDACVYTARIMGARHVENVVGLACRTALARRAPSLVAIPADVQEEPEAHDHASPRNVAHHVSFVTAEGARMPPVDQLDAAAAILEAGERVAILAGQGALGAREALVAVAERLGAPVVKALLGKAVLPDDHPLTTGGIGLLGTRPSQEAMEGCDTLLIVGSSFPYIEYYPKPGQARCVQIDLDPARISLRYPAEVALIGDAGKTLAALAERLTPKADRSFLETAQAGMADWRWLMHDAADRPGKPMKPQRPVRDLGERLPPGAIVVTDSGHNTGLVARLVGMREDTAFSVSGGLAAMACGIPYAIAAAIAHPDRAVFAVVGDGGLSMNLGELVTIVRYGLNVKVLVIDNGTLGQIKWEQMLFLGNPEFGCDLTPIDFAAVAAAMGMASRRVDDPDVVTAAVEAMIAAPGAYLLQAVVDPNEPLLPPKRRESYAANMEKALAAGTPGRGEIERALAEEPARTLLQS